MLSEHTRCPIYFAVWSISQIVAFVNRKFAPSDCFLRSVPEYAAMCASEAAACPTAYPNDGVRRPRAQKNVRLLCRKKRATPHTLGSKSLPI